jgi:phosphoglycerate dehydrogenase-like enzyme
MMRILVEGDHFLKILPVILDPKAGDEHRRAVADFFAHDISDFSAWCEKFRAELPGLYPADVELAADQSEFEDKLPSADAVIVESLMLGRDAIAKMKPLAIVHKFGAVTSNIDVAACEERRITVFKVPRRGNVAVAEQAFALMIALAKGIGHYEGMVTAVALTAAGLPIRPYDRR